METQETPGRQTGRILRDQLQNIPPIGVTGQRFELGFAEIERRISAGDPGLLPNWYLTPTRGKGGAMTGWLPAASASPDDRAKLAEVRHDGWAVRCDKQLVIDCDRHHADADGIKNFASWLDVQMPPWIGNATTIGSTPSGGRHCHYLRPVCADLRKGSGVLAPGVDVLTGSTRTAIIAGPGRLLVGDMRLVPAPAALLAALRIHRPQAKPRDSDYGGDPVRALKGAAYRVADADTGERNAMLNWASYVVGRRAVASGISRNIVADILAAAALDAGLSQAEARTTVRSGLGDAR